MTMCGNTAAGTDICPGWVQVPLPPPGQKTGRGQRRVERVKKVRLRNNSRRSLGMEGSLYEVGTPPPYDSDSSHGPVVR